MDIFEGLKKLYQDSPRAVMLTDSEMTPLWDNGKGVPEKFRIDNIRDYGDKPLELPVKKSCVVRYIVRFGSCLAADISPVGGSGDEPEGYLLQFYGLKDVQVLSDVSDYIRVRNNALGNIREELGQIISLLKRKRDRYTQGGDFDFLTTEKLVDKHILRSLAATVNLSEYSRYCNGVYENENLCVSQILRDICETAAPMLEKRGCEFKYEILPAVCFSTHSDRLRAAVSNLLINAYMYSDAENKKISLKFYKEDGNYAISITDNGKSADKDTLERCKEPFAAFNTFGPNESLGICIASNYCASMGGRLEFSVVKNRHTRAIMFIPAEQSTQQTLQTESTVSIDGEYSGTGCILAKGFFPQGG